MKYEAVFGDQKRFNEQNNEMTEVMLWHDYFGSNFVSIKELSRMTLEGAIPHGSVVLAMRRIIQEPKRWTVEDQKAGIFPDIGCVIQYSSNKEHGIVEAVNKEDYQLCIKTDDGLFISYLQDLKPLETPEEKAQRLRSEWINDAINVVQKTENAGGYEAIYDALLSGALSVPTKCGE